MKREILTALNMMTDDDAGNSIYSVKDGKDTILLLMTNTGIMFIELNSDSDVVSSTGDDLKNMKEIESGFAVTTKNGNVIEYLYINDDGEIDNCTGNKVIVESVELIGNMDELADLVEDGVVPFEMYEWLDDWGVILG